MQNARNQGQFCAVSNEGTVDVVSLLKACAQKKDLHNGCKLDAYIRKHKLLDKNCYVGSSLVSMYAKCGALAKAQQVLNELSVRDVATWTALIGGYAQHGQGEEALKCFDGMQFEGYSPNAVTFICALKACSSIGAVAKGEEIHEKVISLGMLEKNVVLGNTLVDMYAKCGDLRKAQTLFYELPIRNVVTWNALIAGHVQQGQGDEALKWFDNMEHEGYFPNVVTFICASKACESLGSASRVENIHNKVVCLGLLDKDIVLGCTLIDIYAKCGALTKAQKVLHKLSAQDVAAWNALISGYVEHGKGMEALKCFDSMQREGITPNVVTLICVLKACGSVGAVAKVENVHDMIVSLGMLDKDIRLGSTLVGMYAKCGAVDKAQQVLHALPVCDVVMWTALIAGCTEQGQSEQALKCFDNMQHEGHSPDVITFIYALKACGSIGAAAKGKQIHDRIVSLGMLDRDIILSSTLVDMYARCGILDKAHQVLLQFPFRDVATWTALIAGYAQQGQCEEALKCFDDMQEDGHSPDSTAFMCALKACGALGAVTKGENIHYKIVSLGMLEKEIVLGSALVDMYCNCGAFFVAQDVFHELPVRDVVTWTVLMTRHFWQGQGENALKLFDAMQQEGHLPDATTFVYALKACGSIGATNKGYQIHDKIVHMCLLEKHIVLGGTLVDMYAKCAAIHKAVEVFEELPVQDVVTWNALIGGYAQQGEAKEALSCFERMQSRGVRPDSTSLVCVLNACSHSGLLDKAEQYFSRISTDYGITPDAEHYCCMADLFARAGYFSKALEVIEKMPSADYLSIWLAVLSACRNWGVVKVGRLAFRRALHLDVTEESAHICMANIYTAAGMHEDANKIEILKYMKWQYLDIYMPVDMLVE